MTTTTNKDDSFKAGCHHPQVHPVTSSSNKLKIHFTNIRGIRANFDELSIHSSVHKPDIIGITEPLLIDSIPDTQILLPSFHPPFRKNRSKGGITLYIRNSLSFLPLSNLSSPDHDFLWIRLTLNSSERIYLCCLYRSPSSDDSIYEVLSSHIQEFYAKDPSCEVVVCGDFNAHHKTWLGFTNNSDVHGDSALLFSLTNNLVQIVSTPTRFPSNTLLDLFLTSDPDLYTVSTIEPLGTSDHAVVCCTRSISKSDNKVSQQVKRLFNKADWDGLRDFFASYNWTSCENEDVDVHAENITSTILLGIDLFVPTKIIPCKQNSAPWFNLPCLTAYSKKQAAFRKYKSKPSISSHASFKAARNVLKRTIRQAKKEFQKRLQKKIDGSALSSRQFWSLYRSLSGSSKSSVPILSYEEQDFSTPFAKAELLNSIFSANSTLETHGAVPPNLPSRTSHTLKHISISTIVLLLKCLGSLMSARLQAMVVFQQLS